MRIVQTYSSSIGESAARITLADNIYFDISASVVLAADSPIEEEYVWTIRNVGVDHVLIASDFPQISLPRTLEAFAKLDLTDAERAKIRSGNARKLLGL